MTNPNANAGIRALAIGFPKNVRTNDWFREHHKDVVAAAEGSALQKMFDTKNGSAGTKPWDDKLDRYMRDPFRGTVERRVMEPGQSQIDLERDVALSALSAAQLAIEDVDMMLVSSFPSEHVHLGDAAWLANALGTRKPAMNIEATCSGALSSLQVATAMIKAGQARNVLVVVACVYSKTCDFSDAHTWFLGDGVAAYVVSECPEGEGFQAFHSVSTAEACGAFEYRLENVAGGEGGAVIPKPVIRANAPAGRVLRDITPRSIRDACAGVVKKAGMTLDDVDFFVPNTAVAWFHETFAETLGVPVAKTVTTYTDYANIGPALNPVNLYRALSEKRISAGEQVLLFSIGSVSIASAALMRAGEIALGSVVEH